MPIEQIWIRNYRVFRDVKLTGLPPLAVVIGANGSGKSTLFDIFSFLKDALAGNVHSATAKRGGFRELVSRGQQGPIHISIGYQGNDERFLLYLLRLVEREGRVEVECESLIHETDHGTEKFVQFFRGLGKAIKRSELKISKDGTVESENGTVEAEEKKITYELENPSTLAIKAIGQLRDFPLVAELRSLIENWHISNFHIADARTSPEAGYAEHLSMLGENVAQVAQYLHENHPQQFRRVLEAMRARVPGVDAVEAKVTEDGRLVLRFRDGSFKDPFIARHVSDGTIKMFAYLLLLHDPKPHPLVAVEEPENQLYPTLLGELVEEFRDYARRGGQAFISTHSPDFLDAAKLDEIFWLEKVDGFTRVHRAKDDPLLKRLVEEGDLPGALWMQRLFKGVDPQ